MDIVIDYLNGKFIDLGVGCLFYEYYYECYGYNYKEWCLGRIKCYLILL